MEEGGDDYISREQFHNLFFCNIWFLRLLDSSVTVFRFLLPSYKLQFSQKVIYLVES